MLTTLVLATSFCSQCFGPGAVTSSPPLNGRAGFNVRPQFGGNRADGSPILSSGDQYHPGTAPPFVASGGPGAPVVPVGARIDGHGDVIEWIPASGVGNAPYSNAFRLHNSPLRNMSRAANVMTAMRRAALL
jgi:hypothetical protein